MEQRRRKRGIRASREKLEKAMLACGIENQAALARKIAKQEGLERPPRDLVSKVFREQAVSTLNLTRIANALDVPAHLIYLSSSDQTFEDTIEDQNNANKDNQVIKPKPKKRLFHYLVGSFIIFVSIIGYSFYQQSSNSQGQTPRVYSSMGKLLVLILVEDPKDDIAMALVDTYANNQQISMEIASSPDAFASSPEHALTEWQTHLVLKLKRFKGEYYQLLSLVAHSAEHQLPIAQILARGSEITESREFIAEIIETQIARFIEGDSLSVNISESDDDLINYLMLKDKLLKDFTPEDYQASMNTFQQLLSRNPLSTPLLLGACELHVLLSWSQNETESLEQATQLCQNANISPQNAHLYSASNALLFAHVGKTKEAIAVLEKRLSAQLKSADTYALLSDLYLSLYGTSKENINNKIESYALQALALEPKHWKAFNTLGKLYYQSGRVQEAKNQFLEASKIVKQDLILNNLGVMQLCFDELEQAEQTFRELIKQKPDSYIGYESLGTIYFFQQKFEDARDLKRKALELNPDISIHQVWASLGEIQLQLNDKFQAHQYYNRALTLLERDKMLGNIGDEANLYETYYESKISLTNEHQSIRTELIEDIDFLLANEHQFGLREKAHLAWLANQAGYFQTKADLLTSVTEVCPVYERSPELSYKL